MQKIYFLFLSLCITLLFFVAGIKHALTMEGSTSYLAKFPPFSAFPMGFNYIIELIALLIEIVAPIIILLSIVHEKYRHYGKIAAYLLAFFLLCTLVFIHNPFYKGEGMNFLKGLALMGAVLLIRENL